MIRRTTAVVAAVLVASAASALGQSLPDLLKQLTIKWNQPTEPLTLLGNVTTSARLASRRF